MRAVTVGRQSLYVPGRLQFKAGTVKIVIATDVASRGLDIKVNSGQARLFLDRFPQLS